MTVAHLGPPLGREGGPSGYVAQLRRAVDRHGAGGHHLLFPAEAGARPAGAPQRARAVRSWLRRARLTWGRAPAYARPNDADLRRAGGPLDGLIGGAWSQTAAGAAASIDAATAARASILFAHDAAVAEQALQRRAPGQQVWLFLHAPMPQALYQVWCWGVPEHPWEQVRDYPDVQAWMARELGVIGAVDRVWLPCREAADEWIRISPRFEAPLGRASYLLTGAAGPERSQPAADRATLRARWRLPEDAVVALYLGNALAYRGFDLLIRAVEALPPPREAPGVIAVAGIREDRLPLHSRLRALGRVEEVADLTAAVDVLVNVNRFSLLDLSTIEALEAGLPLLLTAVGGNRTFLQLGAGCLMFDEATPEAIARGLTRFFRLPDRERTALQGQSRACYAAHFTPRHLRDRHVAAYDAAALSRPA